MRKIISATFLSLDGVMQAPGDPDEDSTSGFQYGGWTVPYYDDVIAQATAETFTKPFDLLLGRKTYDIFAGYWPHIAPDPAVSSFDAGMADMASTLNQARKYVASRSRPNLPWENSEWLGTDPVARLRELKRSDGPTLVVQGSGDFFQTLLAADLIDLVRLIIYPVTLGKGKRLFSDGTMPAAFTLSRSITSPSGVIIATYERAGEVRTGSFDDKLESNKGVRGGA
jgi:dihydrofolate reductase